VEHIRQARLTKWKRSGKRKSLGADWRARACIVAERRWGMKGRNPASGRFHKRRSPKVERESEDITLSVKKHLRGNCLRGEHSTVPWTPRLPVREVFREGGGGTASCTLGALGGKGGLMVEFTKSGWYRNWEERPRSKKNRMRREKDRGQKGRILKKQICRRKKSSTGKEARKIARIGTPPRPVKDRRNTLVENYREREGKSGLSLKELILHGDLS